MNAPTWLILGLYSITILISLLLASLWQGDIKSRQKSTYLQIVILTALILAADMVSRWHGGPAWSFQFARAGTYLQDLLFPFLGLNWFRYVSHTLLGRTQRVWFAVQTALCCLDIVLLLLPALSGTVFFFDAQHRYHRGPLFAVSYTLVVLMLVISEMFIVAYRRKIAKRYFFPLLAVAFPPLIGGLLQAFWPGLPFALFGATLSELTVFVDVQNRSIDIDYLTGLYNRRSLDNYIDKEMHKSTGEPLSAILFDMDHFKQINDVFGHTAGDTALEDAARLMRKTAGVDAFVARYGGDEFCIVLRSAEPEKTAARIRKKLDEYNARSGRLYHLHFSMGYAVWHPQDHMSRTQFQEKIDRLMYEEKTRRHMERGCEDRPRTE